MKKRIFPFIIALSALSVAGSAAFYSVFGLSKLFAGAATQVIIMAGSLEFAKLVVASLLYQYWDTINKVLKGYLLIACFVLMVITSGGIYGFLSGAYQSTATQSELLDKSLVILEHKQSRFTETKDDLTIEKTQLNKSIADLRISLSNPHQVSYWDENSQTVITTTSSSTRRALQAELKNTIVDRDNINLKLDAILDSITTTDMVLLNKEISNEDQRELGPLKYLSNTTGWAMDKVVNYFLLLIIFVFDPLAIALVVAANMAFAKIKRKEPEVVMSVPEGVEFNKPYIIESVKEVNTTHPSESMKQRVKENQDKLKEMEPPIGLREEEINEPEGVDEDYFTDLEGYIKYTREEDIENLTYPQFIEKHYPKPQTEINTYGDDEWATPTPPKEEEEKINILTSTDNLSEEELNDISREIAKNETLKMEEKISPTEEDLEKLAEVLNIKETDDDNNEDIDRITDTTKTLITKVINKETKNDTTLKYQGRK